MPQTDDRHQFSIMAAPQRKGRPKNTVVIVFLGVEDHRHRENLFVSLSLALKVQALALRAQALALALRVQALALMVQALAFKFWP